jgi:hypothetical protein
MTKSNFGWILDFVVFLCRHESLRAFCKYFPSYKMVEQVQHAGETICNGWA